MEEFKPGDQLVRVNSIEGLKALPHRYLCQKAILGIDIYRYSQYPIEQQTFIPVVFNELYKATVKDLVKGEPFIFRDYGLSEADFEKRFINAGDGGFQIFNNPLEALIFAIYFQMNVKLFLSGSSKIEHSKLLRELIDNIDLRYSITSDLTYFYNANYFGPAIINNARILSKDNLNRLLIDSNSIKWFTKNMNSVENLLVLEKKSFLSLPYFSSYDENFTSLLFQHSDSFKSVDVLAIGSIMIKNTPLEIFNLHVQAIISFKSQDDGLKKFVVTLGNLNTAGIET